MMISIAMSENGRVLIPSAIREELGFKLKGKIFVEIKDGSLVLTPAAQRSAQMRAYFDKHLPPFVPKIPGQDSVDEFIAERRAETAREDAE
jgi:bifunctional DNA-binding transcriptional regulator/antitoxin component of YhaV-PrlF toxin-antitoxin module